jgi:hypothetical protein
MITDTNASTTKRTLEAQARARKSLEDKPRAVAAP